MNHLPLISVIMPVYNTEKYVAEAIRSVLGQTWTNLELVCVNDGSTDGSLEILRSFGNRIVLVDCAKNGGIAEARNQGIKAATGEFLALMDADDLWEPEKLSLQMDQFEHDAALDVSFTMMKCFISPDLPDEVKKMRHCPPDPMPGYISATAVIRKTSFDKVGYFNPAWRVGEFIDWFEKAKALGMKSTMVDQVLFLRRIHETNTGVTERPSRVDYLRIVKQALDRKKQSDQNT